MSDKKKYITLPEGAEVSVKFKDSKEWEPIGITTSNEVEQHKEKVKREFKSCKGEEIKLSDMKIEINFDLIEFNNTIRGKYEIVDALQIEDKREEQ